MMIQVTNAILLAVKTQCINFFLQCINYLISICMFLYVFTLLIAMAQRFAFFICILVQGICVLVAYDPRGRLVHAIPFISAEVWQMDEDWGVFITKFSS